MKIKKKKNDRLCVKTGVWGGYHGELISNKCLEEKFLFLVIFIYLLAPSRVQDIISFLQGEGGEMKMLKW